MSILDKIVTYKKEELAAAKARVPPSTLDQLVRTAPPLRDFFAALSRKCRTLPPHRSSARRAAGSRRSG